MTEQERIEQWAADTIIRQAARLTLQRMEDEAGQRKDGPGTLGLRDPDETE